MQHLDSEGLPCHDDSYSSGEDWDPEAEGVMLEVAIPDMRLEAEAGHRSRTILEVSPLGEAGSVFTLRLATSHHSFSLGRSVATRSAEAFYQLQVTQNLLCMQLSWLKIDSWLSMLPSSSPESVF